MIITVFIWIALEKYFLPKTQGKGNNSNNVRNINNRQYQY